MEQQPKQYVEDDSMFYFINKISQMNTKAKAIHYISHLSSVHCRMSEGVRNIISTRNCDKMYSVTFILKKH